MGTLWVRILAIVLVALACSAGARQPNRPRPVVEAVEAESCNSGSAGLIGLATPPADPAVVALGRRLFADVRLSIDHSVSCASCHKPEWAFTDGRTRSLGAHDQVGNRNAPTLYNVAYLPRFLWDGRAASLEQQVKIALTNPREMGMTRELLEQRLLSEQSTFNTILGGLATPDAVAVAIATYERTLLAGGTPVDRYLYCSEAEALTPEQKQGLALFSGPANCIRCHWFAHESVHPFGGQLALFTDNRFHNIGAGESDDPGRAEVTDRPEDWGAFKTPTLRNVAVTAPYMHDGSLTTLRGVVEFYNRGGRRNPQLDPSIRPLGLTDAEINALVAFLVALTSPEAQANAHQTGSPE